MGRCMKFILCNNINFIHLCQRLFVTSKTHVDDFMVHQLLNKNNRIQYMLSVKTFLYVINPMMKHYNWKYNSMNFKAVKRFKLKATKRNLLTISYIKIVQIWQIIDDDDCIFSNFSKTRCPRTILLSYIHI